MKTRLATVSKEKLLAFVTRELKDDAGSPPPYKIMALYDQANDSQTKMVVFIDGRGKSQYIVFKLAHLANLKEGAS